ncbi:MAG: hypothetical protein HJJLKODD_02178 [Phycisphaerae bacterium]|nr:hypothetical protein [Phycisphaerae bacterium]
MINRWWLITGIMLLLQPGCATTEPNSTPVPYDLRLVPNEPASTVFPDRTPGAQAMPTLAETTILEIHLYIWKFAAPAPAYSGYEALWNHLNESPVGVDELLRIKRNGWRVGVGNDASWAAVRALLLRPEPVVSASEIVALPGQNITLQLQEGVSSSTEVLFHFDDQMELHGARYQTGLPALRLELAVDYEELTRLGMKITPELLRQGNHLTAAEQWSQPGVTVEQPEIFDFLAFTVAMKMGDFLLIGPGPHAAQTHLLGNYFTSQIQGTLRQEFIYCIVPRYYQRSLKWPRSTGLVQDSSNDQRME